MRRKAGWLWILISIPASSGGWLLAGQTPPACRTGDLKIRLAREEVAMATVSDSFMLTNHGSRTCSLSGYPSAVAFDRKRRAVSAIHFQQVKDVNGAGDNLQIQLILVKPGEHAWFQITSSDGTGLDDSSFCNKAALVQIRPPQNERPFRKLFPFGTCTPTPGISLLLPGSP